MSGALPILTLLLPPVVICFIVGNRHGARRSVRWRWIGLAAFGLSLLLCWSIIFANGHPPGVAVLPAWLVSPLALFDERSSIWPSPWLHPWLAFAAYWLGAWLERSNGVTRPD